MHNAPSVIYPVGRCRFFAALLLLLSVTALTTLILWWSIVSSRSSIHLLAGWAGAVLWLGWTFQAARYWRRSPHGRLEWDAVAPAVSLIPNEGQGAWLWRDARRLEATRLHGLEIAVDLQILALLRLKGPGSHPRWTWVERRRYPLRWNDLRRALHSTGA